MQLSGHIPNTSSYASAPERILQFGTGVLLRGLCDFIIDKANKTGDFSGKIVVVKSTSTGGADAFDVQNGRYTVAVRGIDDGQVVSENVIVDAISRVIAASSNWADVLAVAADPGVDIIISNTTEVGIQYVNESIFQSPPSSFPAKLLAVLYHRFQQHPEVGFTIIPTELIVNNGAVLKEIILKLAHSQDLPIDFIHWIGSANQFCNSLVDRIVPGKPNDEKLKAATKECGYSDELYIEAEAYKLWAIEGNAATAAKLSFAKADTGMAVVPNIEIFRELKLRLLNGTHTLLCGLGYLYGHRLVREVMNDTLFNHFIENLMHTELTASIPYEVDTTTAKTFGNQVLDRFRNPFVDHQLLSITVQYTTKMKARNIPLLLKHVERVGFVPTHFACGFAGYLLFMKAVKIEGGKYYGELNGEFYEIKCDQASVLYSAWQTGSIHDVVTNILANKTLWEQDLTTIPNFVEAVKTQLSLMMRHSVRESLNKLLHEEVLKG